jgi:hypothetical protein
LNLWQRHLIPARRNAGLYLRLGSLLDFTDLETTFILFWKKVYGAESVFQKNYCARHSRVARRLDTKSPGAILNSRRLAAKGRAPRTGRAIIMYSHVHSCSMGSFLDF